MDWENRSQGNLHYTVRCTCSEKWLCWRLPLSLIILGSYTPVTDKTAANSSVCGWGCGVTDDLVSSATVLLCICSVKLILCSVLSCLMCAFLIMLFVVGNAEFSLLDDTGHSSDKYFVLFEASCIDCDRNITGYFEMWIHWWLDSVFGHVIIPADCFHLLDI